jgi:hypothetical protein
MHRESRIRRAWRDTKSLEQWRWRIIESLAVLSFTYWALRRMSKPEDIAENVVLGIGAGLVTLALMPLLEFAVRWLQAGRKLAEEQIPLDELRSVISQDIREHGPQAIWLSGTMRHYGFPFSHKHIEALKVLQANGEVGRVDYHGGLMGADGHPLVEATVWTVRELDG